MNEPQSPKHSFFAELKRRNVYKIGAMYCVAGWLLVQIVTQVFPIFHVSELAQRIIVLAIVAGFPLALVLSWIYELTPQGIVRTDEVAPDVSVTRQTGQKLNRAIIGVLSVAVLVLLARQFWQRGPAVDHDSDSDKSIAVLPFENLSDDKANAYFAVGMQDEILTRLAKIGALKVISRTSTAHYASSPDNLPEIARQLGVANILEGSVQKIGDAVHVNVQLIRAASDAHLWAETYDRKLDNIFGVEGEVAGAIAAQLNAKLSGAEQQALQRWSTDNAGAYDLALQGRAEIAENQDFHGYRRLADLMGEATKLDPQFAQAWAEQSIAAGYLYFNGIDRDRFNPEFIKNSADTALRLQPDLPLAREARGAYLYRVERDFAGARAELESALAVAPNDSGLLMMLGWDERREGHFEQALEHLEKAAELDPHDAQLFASIGGETLIRLGRYDEARSWLDRSLAMAPDFGAAKAYKVLSYQHQGRFEDAARLLASIEVAGQDPLVADMRGAQCLYERRFEQCIVELTPLLAQGQAALQGFGPALRAQLGLALLRAGHAAEARANYEQLIREIGPDGVGHADDTLQPMWLAFGYAGTGQNSKAVEQARRAVELYRNDHIFGWWPVETLAAVQAWTGDLDGAITTLQAAGHVVGGSTPAILQHDPLWDPLRQDPRFQKLAGATGP